MKIAFIIGCARSGTSILGELIGAHPEVAYIFEAHQVWEQAGFGVNGSHRLTAAHATPEVTLAIRQWFEARQGQAARIVEKNPRNSLRVPFLRAVFPEAGIIHIVRDGRDVACSMVPGCGGSEWSHLKPPSWQTFFTTSQGPIRCALAWKEILEIALSDLRDVSHLQIRYEDLVADPRRVSERVLTYLGLPFHPAVEAFCGRIQNVSAGSYHARHQVTWFRPDHRVRAGRWRENLSRDEQHQITTLLSPLLTRLGYPVD
ncbi:MAG: sulfotransferase [candidate division NC10 bacterium]|nr:sulfotransferase [candidate division NC10 bacterium]MDE2321408.1 sulfotransferase [candidate division NC10 bacterium]